MTLYLILIDGEERVDDSNMRGDDSNMRGLMPSLVPYVKAKVVKNTIPKKSYKYRGGKAFKLHKCKNRNAGLTEH